MKLLFFLENVKHFLYKCKLKILATSLVDLEINSLIASNLHAFEIAVNLVMNPVKSYL